MTGIDSSPVFVGRSVELALLGEAGRRAVGGEPTVVVVGGEAGVGKTRLATESIAGLGPDVLPLVGRCVPGVGRGLPYAPFADLFRAMARRLPAGRLTRVLGPAREELGLVVPEFETAPVTGWVGAHHAEIGESRSVSRARLFELLLTVADRLQADSPTAVLLEDLQWADDGTLDLLAFLGRNVEAGRILLLATVRTDDLRGDGRVAGTIAELERTGRVVRVELGRLTPDETRAQAVALLGRTVDRDVVDTIVARSDGNPFFVEELAAAQRRGMREEVPPLLDDLLRARFATVREDTRAILRLAAIVGTEVDDRLIAAAAGATLADIDAGLREASARGLLVRTGRSPVRYAFRHALLRETVESDLLPGEARVLHAACAEALAGSARPELVAAEVARHWLLAGDPARALPAAVVAGLEAERRFAFADARRQFETAADLWDTAPEAARASDLDRVAVLAHAAEAAALAGEPRAAALLSREAIGLVDSGTDPRRAASMHERLRWYLWEAGDRDGAERALDEALALVPAEPASPTRARVLAQLAGLRLRQARIAESEAVAAQAIATARACGALPELAFALGVRAWDAAQSGRPDGAVADVREAVAIAELLERPEGRALGAVNLAGILLYVGRPDEALTAAHDGLDLVRRIGLERVYGGSLAATAAAASFRLGDWTAAATSARAALALPPPGPDALWPAAVAIMIASGRGDDDLRTAGEAVAAAALPDATDRLHRSWYRVATAQAALVDGGGRRARQAAQEGLADLGSQVLDEAVGWLTAVALRVAADDAEAALAMGDDEAVRAARRDASVGAKEWSRRSKASPAVDDRMADALGALVAVEARRAAGIADVPGWERVGDALEQVGSIDGSAYARYREAEALLRGRGAARRRSQSDREQAGRRLQVAFDAARRLAALPLLESITLLARRARLEEALATGSAAPDEARSSAVRPDVAGLGFPGSATRFLERRGITPRETEVLALVGAGWSNGEIARALFISRKTASVHVSNILGKLGAADRVEAAAMANRVGLVGPARPGSALDELLVDAEAGAPGSKAPGSG